MGKKLCYVSGLPWFSLFINCIFLKGNSTQKQYTESFPMIPLLSQSAKALQSCDQKSYHNCLPWRSNSGSLRPLGHDVTNEQCICVCDVQCVPHSIDNYDFDFLFFFFFPNLYYHSSSTYELQGLTICMSIIYLWHPPSPFFVSVFSLLIE